MADQSLEAAKSLPAELFSIMVDLVTDVGSISDAAVRETERELNQSLDASDRGLVKVGAIIGAQTVLKLVRELSGRD